MHLLLPRLRQVLEFVNRHHSPTEAVELETINKAILSTGAVDEIVRFPVQSLNMDDLCANFTSATSTEGRKTAIITHLAYDEADPLSDPKYPEIRFAITKEMIHVFDSEEEKTRAHEAVVDLMERLVSRELFDGNDGKLDALVDGSRYSAPWSFSFGGKRESCLVRFFSDTSGPNHRRLEFRCQRFLRARNGRQNRLQQKLQRIHQKATTGSADKRFEWPDDPGN